MGGRNIHYRVALAQHREALYQRLDAPPPPRPNMTGTCEDCKHPWSEHEDEGSGCLHGWGEPPATGCMCPRA